MSITIDLEPLMKENKDVLKTVTALVFMLGHVINVKEFIYVANLMATKILHTAAFIKRHQVIYDVFEFFVYL